VQFVQFWNEEQVRPPRILVAEDDEAVRRVLVRFLRGRGCDVLEVASDIRMPGSSGLEVWRAASAWHPELKHRFVFVSALAAEAPVSGEGVRVLSKPFEMAALWQEVRAVLERRG